MHREAPECLDCRVATRWFRSELLRDFPKSIIANLYVCPNCKRAERTNTEFAAERVLPDILDGPGIRVVRDGKV